MQTFEFVKTFMPKCFLNEKEGLITSMNLHEYSQTHNWEMGIVLTKADDPVIYDAALNEVMMIVEQSTGESKNKTCINRSKTSGISLNIQSPKNNSYTGRNTEQQLRCNKWSKL